MNILDQKFPPKISYNETLTNQLANTQGAIASLNQMIRLLQNPLLLMNPILGKEAESSAQLEGTQASIEDVYKINIIQQSPEKINQALEIQNYRKAMLKGLDLIKEMEINNVFVRGLNQVLLQGVRGKDRNPGMFRMKEVWVGTPGKPKSEARYVPPEHIHVKPLMDNLQMFIYDYKALHPLIACALIHYRFEAIHPFEDGNGRTGRLLITLFLIKEGILRSPILYPSGFFEKNREHYMSTLSSVDKNEDWYSWLLFFLKALEEQATLSLEVGLKIDNLFKESRTKIESEKANLNLIRVLEYTFTQPYITASIINKKLRIPLATCKRYLKALAEKDIIANLGIINKQRVYANINLLSILKSI